MQRKTWTFCAVGICAAMGGFARAGDLINNGDFSAGSSAWSFQNSDDGSGGITNVGAAHGNIAFIGDNPSSVSQQFIVTSSGSYTLSFDAQTDQTGIFGDPAAVGVSVTGLNVSFSYTGHGTSTLPTSWSNYPFALGTLNPGTYLLTLSQTAFDASGDNAADIDNVSIPVSAPEPGTAALLAAAFTGMLIRRRKR